MNLYYLIPREVSLELGCFAWAATADLVVFKDDVVTERTEPGKKQHLVSYRWSRNEGKIQHFYTFLKIKLKNVIN